MFERRTFGRVLKWRKKKEKVEISQLSKLQVKKVLNFSTLKSTKGPGKVLKILRLSTGRLQKVLNLSSELQVKTTKTIVLQKLLKY